MSLRTWVRATALAMASVAALATFSVTPAQAHVSVSTRADRVLARSADPADRALSLVRRTVQGGLARDVALAYFPGPSFTVAAFTVKTTDPNYPVWRFGAYVLGRRTYIAATTERASADGYQLQLYDWTKQVPKGHVVISHDLSRASIDTGTELASFGSIDMTFTRGQHKMHRFVCARTHRLIAVTRGARGVFDGTMTFTPNADGLPTTITATHVRAQLERYVTTGHGCPRPGHDHVHQVPLAYRCPGERSFVMHAGTGATLRSEVEYGFTQVRTSAVLDGVTVTELGLFEPDFGPFGDPDTPVTVTKTDLTLDGDQMGGLFSGILTFERVDPPQVHTGKVCATQRSAFAWSHGHLNVAFDTGALQFRGAHLQAQIIWRHRAS
jgi:hypothetical protein